MSIEWVLYFLGMVPNLIGIPIFLIIASVVGFLASLVAWDIGSRYSCDEICDKGKTLKKRLFICLVSLFLAFALGVLIPSEKTMYAIALAHYSKQSNIPEKVLKAIEVKLDKVIEDKLP